MAVGENPYKLLMQKVFYEILDGSACCGKEPYVHDSCKVNVSMPYLTGENLCEICANFGVPGDEIKNLKDNHASRWMYVEALLTHCVESETCPDLLAYFLDRRRYFCFFRDDAPAVKEEGITYFLTGITEQINSLLYNDGACLVKSGGRYIVAWIGEKVYAAEPTVDFVNLDSVNETKTKVLELIEQRQYNDAIAKSCSLLEGIFAYVIRKEENKDPPSKDIRAKYREIRDIYNFHPESEPNKYIQEMVSGLNSVISPFSDLRSKHGNVHDGVPNVKMEEHHAVLCLNIAITIGEFVLSLEENSCRRIIGEEDIPDKRKLTFCERIEKEK